MRAFSRLVAATSLMFLLPMSSAAADPDDYGAQFGLSDTRPESGRFVKVGDRYMVPYQATIPGTKVTYTMEPIPGGQFTLGSPATEAERSDDEGPQRTITVEPFWMGKYEVTWGEYFEFMKLYLQFQAFNAAGVRPVTPDNEADAVTAPSKLHEPSTTFERGQDPRHPAVSMTQYAAKQYTHWLSGLTGRQYRLPTEAEWEYACRAGTKTAYYFGEDSAQLADHAWFVDNADDQLQFVGQKKPNAWGLHDTLGSVWEWTLDGYHEDGYARLDDVPHSAVEAIAWPEDVYPCVLRGGSWDDDADRCRAAAKLASDDEEWKYLDPQVPKSPWWYSDEPAFSVGFRVIRPLKMHSKAKMARYWQADHEEILDAVNIKLEGQRSARGLVDKDLPAAAAEVPANK